MCVNVKYEFKSTSSRNYKKWLRLFHFQKLRISADGKCLRKWQFAESAALLPKRRDRNFFGAKVDIIFCRTLEILRTEIENKEAAYAVLPVENSLIGKVERTNQFLETFSWQTADVRFLPIRQNLISCRAARLETIESVESHPAALAQCERFFLSNLHLRQVTSENTAASAKAVIESGDATRAAIANAKTAEIFGGKILLEDIQDGDENFTKFLLYKEV